MGLRCSLLGHDYGEPFVERGREERGNEVVVTERELQECARCGTENVTTENTEVRSIESTSGGASTSTADAAADAAAGGSSADDTATAAGGSSDSDSATADADSSGGAFTSASDAIERAEADMQTEDTVSPTASSEADVADTDDAGDDGVIIDGSADDAAGSEQWDDQSDVDPDAEAEPVPETDDEDVEFVDSTPSGDTGTAGGTSAGSSGAPAGSGGASADAESDHSNTGSQRSANMQSGQSAGTQAVTTERSGDRTRGEWPEPEEEDVGVDATADDTSFQFGDEDEQFVAADTGFTSAGPLEQSDSEDSLDFALYCPECGFERAAAGSSLRAGDICPDCRKGYLAEDR